jgi:hypothetical protein
VGGLNDYFLFVLVLLFALAIWSIPDHGRCHNHGHDAMITVGTLPGMKKPEVALIPPLPGHIIAKPVVSVKSATGDSGGT